MAISEINQHKQNNALYYWFEFVEKCSNDKTISPSDIVELLDLMEGLIKDFKEAPDVERLLNERI